MSTPSLVTLECSKKMPSQDEFRLILENRINTYPDAKEIFQSRNKEAFSHKVRVFDITFAPLFKTALDNQVAPDELAHIAAKVNSFPLFQLVCKFGKISSKELLFSEKLSQGDDPSLTKMTNLFETATNYLSIDFIRQSIKMLSKMSECLVETSEKEEIIEAFLSQKIGKDTLPIWAVKNEQLTLLEEMISIFGITARKLILNNGRGQSPMGNAISQGNLKLVQTLFHFLDNESLCSVDEIRPLARKAIKDGKLEIVQFFVEMSSPKLDVLIAGSQEEESLIGTAIEKEREDILNYLINLPRMSFKILMKPTRKKETLDAYAAAKGNINILNLLNNFSEMTLEKWLEPKGPFKQTLAQIAVINGQVEVLEFLGKLPGMTIPLLMRRTTCGNLSLVHLAAEYGHHNIIDYFINVLKLPLNSLTDFMVKEGQTPAHLAAKYGHHQVLNSLAQAKGMTLELLMKENINGRTPAHIAAMFNEVDSLNFLINMKGMTREMIFSTDKEGLTLAHLACYYKRNESLKFLLNHPKVSISMFIQADKREVSVLDMAVKTERYDGIFKLMSELPEDQCLSFIEQIISSYIERIEKMNIAGKKRWLVSNFMKLRIGSDKLVAWVIKRGNLDLLKKITQMPEMHFRLFMEDSERREDLMTCSITSGTLEIIQFLFNYINSNCKPSLPESYVSAYAEIAGEVDRQDVVLFFQDVLSGKGKNKA